MGIFMDTADKAQADTEAIEQRIFDHLKSTEKKEGVVSLFCSACFEPIPEARRQAVPGCSLCVDCQAESEAAR